MEACTMPLDNLRNVFIELTGASFVPGGSPMAPVLQVNPHVKRRDGNTVTDLTREAPIYAMSVSLTHGSGHILAASGL
jgi:hypothetical protein